MGEILKKTSFRLELYSSVDLASVDRLGDPDRVVRLPTMDAAVERASRLLGKSDLALIWQESEGISRFTTVIMKEDL